MHSFLSYYSLCATSLILHILHARPFGEHHLVRLFSLHALHLFALDLSLRLIAAAASEAPLQERECHAVRAIV